MDTSNEVVMSEPESSSKDSKDVEVDALMELSLSSEESEQECSEESTDESSDEYSEYTDDSSEEESITSLTYPPELYGKAKMEESSEEESEDCASESEDIDIEAETNYSMKVCYVAARIQSDSVREKHLVKSINNVECSDLEFICKDGDKVYATKMMCMGRSEMLDAMFKSGMSESHSSVIRVPEISSRALLAILEFLYLSVIYIHRPTDWKIGLEILDAAHFFMLQFVGKIVERYLVELVKGIGRNLQQAAEMLSMAMEYKFLHEGDRYVSLLRLVHLLKNKWMHKDCVFHLTEQAVDYILRHTRPKALRSRERTKISLDEYFRFRGVLMWAICNSHVVGTDHAEVIFDRIIPADQEKLYSKVCENGGLKKLVWLPGYKVSRSRNKIAEILNSHQVCKGAAARLLETNIDWMRIPPQLSLRIMEPLKLVPDSQLLDIFRSHFKQCQPHESSSE